MTNKVDYSFAETLAGTVTQFDWEKNRITLKTSDGQKMDIYIDDTTSGEVVRNLGEEYRDCTGQLKDMLAPGRPLFAHGVFYAGNADKPFHAKHVLFLGEKEEHWRFEEQEWWKSQADQLGEFYFNAQFPKGEVDYSHYQTELSLDGDQEGSRRQEADTISRLVYGFASAYMLTGKEKYLEAAEKGTQYLRDHFRFVDKDKGIAYWVHAIDFDGKNEKKVLASDFGDDYEAIPAYEQIYALAGPTQTYRITGDPEIKSDIDQTIKLFDDYFKDSKKGGYFSHVDPLTFDPNAESLGHNRSRKNWNSVGDHAPAYLINAWLATEDESYLTMLVELAKTITEHFPDDDNSPFVQERFHADWSADKTWGWQKDSAVVGHNLKIAWNLMRIYHKVPEGSFKELAEKIGKVMPAAGSDQKRGGWYDVVQRTKKAGDKEFNFVWHNRKAWWQQEQAILAYLILAGSSKQPEFVQQAREAQSFYNAWFLDHDSGGVYFNVMANGLPFLTGTERFKGSHSMSGYHSFELCYLATVYQQLLIGKKPLTLYFKPTPDSLKDGILRVSPDMLPAGSVTLTAVRVDGKAHSDFDSDNLSVKLPSGSEPVKVEVILTPQGYLQEFKCSLSFANKRANLDLSGRLNKGELGSVEAELSTLQKMNPSQVVIGLDQLTEISDEGIRALTLGKEKLPTSVAFFFVGGSEGVRSALQDSQLAEETRFVASVSEVPTLS